jgi:hypothetical protein
MPGSGIVKRGEPGRQSVQGTHGSYYDCHSRRSHYWSTSGLTEPSKQVIADAYGAFKVLLKKKFGDQSEVVKSVENLEAKLESPNRQGMLKEEVQAVQADQDPDPIQAAQTLLDQIKVLPGGEQHIVPTRIQE